MATKRDRCRSPMRHRAATPKFAFTPDSYRVNRIAATSSGTSENVNQEIVVNPDMKNATPNHTARRFGFGRA